MLIQIFSDTKIFLCPNESGKTWRAKEICEKNWRGRGNAIDCETGRFFIRSWNLFFTNNQTGLKSIYRLKYLWIIIQDWRISGRQEALNKPLCWQTIYNKRLEMGSANLCTGDFLLSVDILYICRWLDTLCHS